MKSWLEYASTALLMTEIWTWRGLVAGVVAVIWVSESIWKVIACSEQPALGVQTAFETWLVPVKPLPVMTSVVPPELGPKWGLKSSTTAAKPKLNSRQKLLQTGGEVPPTACTLITMWPVPGWAGVVTCSWVSESTTSPVPGSPPKVTLKLPGSTPYWLKPVPVRVTSVPPVQGPLKMSWLLMVGGP